MGLLILPSGDPFNLGGGGQGRVTLLDFPPFPLPSGLGQIFGQGLGRHLDSFLMQFIDDFLCGKAAFLHPLQCRSQCQDGLLDA
ncbi:MAG: hypothetical protein K2G99_06630, partial [Desulfovibrio sp.]|nr:hypothetical protein [Desulfovibrio sp.]